MSDLPWDDDPAVVEQEPGVPELDLHDVATGAANLGCAPWRARAEKECAWHAGHAQNRYWFRVEPRGVLGYCVIRRER